MVYSIAIEKLNTEKTDLRKLKVEEEGDALKVLNLLKNLRLL